MQNQFNLTPYFLDRPEADLERLAAAGWEINRPPLPEGSTQARLVALYRPLVDLVAAAAAAGDRPVSIAGDCVTSLAVLAGLQRAGISPTLIWFDAHGDFNDWTTTPSGFLGGMPLAMAVGRGDQAITAGIGLQPIPEDQVILTDARDLDPGEREALAESGVIHLRNAEQLLDYDLPDRPLYVHFDTDILDPSVAPAMNYPAQGGPDAETLRRVFQRLAQSGRVVAVSLSSWAPELDESGKSRTVCIELLEELIAG
jgi:arginase